MWKFTFLLLFLCYSVLGQFQKELIDQKLTLPQMPTKAETIIQIGKSFLEVPYVPNTLEEGSENKEKLTCRLDAFDCYTFVENVLALTLIKHTTNNNYHAFIDQLMKLRYRNGQIEDYASRIHYFSEWAKNAQRKGYLIDYGRVLGEPNKKRINFMSTHKSYYPRLEKDPEILTKIQNMEVYLSKQPYYFIPKEKFKNFQSAIKSGDIIGFTSKINGLDVNHEGIALWKDRKLHFIHASVEEKKVVISDETINEYITRVKKHDGIMVLRIRP